MTYSPIIGVMRTCNHPSSFPLKSISSTLAPLHSKKYLMNISFLSFFTWFTNKTNLHIHQLLLLLLLQGILFHIHFLSHVNIEPKKYLSSAKYEIQWNENFLGKKKKLNNTLPTTTTTPFPLIVYEWVDMLMICAVKGDNRHMGDLPSSLT